MIRLLMRHNSHSAACLARILLIVLNGVHVAVHGTPLDFGALDAAILQLDQALTPLAMTDG